MRRYVYVGGAVLGVILTALAAVLIAVRTGQMPQVMNPLPVLAALAACVVAWWVQGLIVALLAQPRLGRLRVGEMFRIYMAGTFVTNASPLRGAEIPYEVYLLKRLGLSAAEGSTVVVGRILLDVVILLPAIVVSLALAGTPPAVETPSLLLVGLAMAGVWAVAVLAGRKWSKKLPPGGTSWRAKAVEKIRDFFGEMRSNLTAYWRPGHRATLLCAVALTPVYWAFRLSCAPLALMAVGWSGDWIPVILAQLLLNSVIVPLVPTPGGSGTRELVFVSLLSAHAPEGQLLGGVMLYSGLTYALPAIVGAFFFGRELWRGIQNDQEGPDGASRGGRLESAVGEAGAPARSREPVISGGTTAAARQGRK